ncbi:AprI/Inh family metalloprotease inhibitor [Pseudomonas hefeiensis]|uniref:AprI/Inh family metalloprotease inhibitor n=1 Tax=Pseudomonas hefeiensis TaxID=2738125 RepID=A0ABY9G3C2_9PSED|nr:MULTISPECIES: AprI/Inh family metalloprotease inhibitor [unclassified Pseudomonas]WLH10115.1 AprI/Inh family metalloprotease inhibitor [Pseudomonas sp. FP205]WLH93197.1 AprI/Inh family metalloprotease inhibitor [Pseudomonas sp. FP53]WLI37483.1 AprI/Inh family metalloprotease inhibitor [Pseudomonas sp. FP821]
MCRNPKPRGAQASAWLLATLMMFTGEVAMARSLLLAEPSQLAGQWQAVLSGPQASAQTPPPENPPSSICLVELQADQTLGGQTDCLGQWLGDEPVRWFTEPDGLSLIGKQNTRVHLQLHQEQHYQVTLKSGRVVTLERRLAQTIP